MDFFLPVLAVLEHLPFWFKADEESYWDLIHDGPHWELELTIMFIFDILLFGLVWPFVKRHIHRDIEASESEDDERHRKLEERVKALEDAA